MAALLVSAQNVRADRLIDTDYTQNGGTFTLDPPDTLYIDGPANPLLTLTHGATTTGVLGAYIGASRLGRLLVEDGSVFGSGNGWIGVNSGSTGTATVTGSGSAWNNSGGIFIGSFGNGTLRIENGGAVNTAFGTITSATSSTATATVTGSGSAWNNSGGLTVGLFGNGSLRIEDGGVASSAGGTIGAVSAGTATVTGSGSAWNNSGELNVGVDGNGTLAIENGGVVNSGSGDIGFDTGSGTAIVAGTGSTWNIGGFLNLGSALNIQDPDIDSHGTGTLTIKNGGRVEVGNGGLTLASDSGASGTVNLEAGGTLDLNGGDVNFGNGTANFNFNGGTLAGVGHFNGDLYQQGGSLEPGNSPGTTVIAGDYILDPGASVVLEVRGNGAGEYDRLVVEGQATLAGIIQVIFEGYTPAAGESFDLLTFASFVDNGFRFEFNEPGLTWNLGTDGTLSVKAVPLPTPLVLFASASTLLCGFRKRYHL